MNEGLAPETLVYVARLFVVPAGRGSGVGAALLKEAVAYALTQGWRAALEVAAEAQDAVRLYERMGWRRAATETAHWQNERGESPVMHVYLSPPA